MLLCEFILTFTENTLAFFLAFAENRLRLGIKNKLRFILFYTRLALFLQRFFKKKIYRYYI